MKHLIIYEYRKFFSTKINLLLLFFLLVIYLAIILNMKIKVNISNVSSNNELYFWNIEGYLVLFWATINLILPFIWIQYLTFEINNDFLKRIGYLPLHIFKIYASKLLIGSMLIGLFFLPLSLFLIWGKAFPNTNSTSIFFQFIPIKWLFFMSLLSLLYLNILQCLFFIIRSLKVLYAFHVINVILCFYDSFYWIPAKWAKIYIDFIYNSFHLLSFFKTHPPNILVLIIPINILITCVGLKLASHESKDF